MVKERDGTLQVGYVTKSLFIQGSLRRSNFTDPDDPHTAPVGAVSTIIDAEEAGRVIYVADNISPVFEDMAFVNGDATVAGGGTNGGGVFISGGIGRPEFRQIWNCANIADNGGGYYADSTASAYVTGGYVGSCNPAEIVYVDENDNAVSAEYADFAGNQATTNGGGLYAAGDLEIVNLLIQNNIALAGRGGGYYNSGSDNTIINGIFYSNTAPIEGGGIFNSGDQFALYHNTIRDNVAGGNGGGVMNIGSGLIANSSVFYNNTAVAGTGGGLNSGSGTLAYNNFYANSPDGSTVAGTNSISADPEFLGTWSIWYTLTQYR